MRAPSSQASIEEPALAKMWVISVVGTQKEHAVHLQYMQWCCCSVMLHHGWHSSTLASCARADVQGFAMMAGRRSLSRCNMQQSDTTGERAHHYLLPCCDQSQKTKCTRVVTMSPNGRLEPSLLPPPAATSMTGFAAGMLRARPSLLANFAMLPPYLFSKSFFEAALESMQPQEAKDALLGKANNNMLITSLLLGASFSMIGAVYVPHGWDAYSPHALAFESAVEALGLCSCLFFLVALLANVSLATTAAAVSTTNFKVWAKANPISIILADTLVMVGLWLFGMALVLTGFAAIPHRSVFYASCAIVGPITTAAMLLMMNAMPLLTAESGVMMSEALMTDEQAIVLTPSEAEAILYARALTVPRMEQHAALQKMLAPPAADVAGTRSLDRNAPAEQPVTQEAVARSAALL